VNCKTVSLAIEFIVDKKDSFSWPILQAVCIQAVVLLICTGYKDGGARFDSCVVVSVAFWLIAFTVVVIRGKSATVFSRAFVQWGLIPFVVFGTPVVRLIMERLQSG
jgi:hypothetical protein